MIPPGCRPGRIGHRHAVDGKPPWPGEVHDPGRIECAGEVESAKGAVVQQFEETAQVPGVAVGIQSLQRDHRLPGQGGGLAVHRRSISAAETEGTDLAAGKGAHRVDAAGVVLLRKASRGQNRPIVLKLNENRQPSILRPSPVSLDHRSSTDTNGPDLRVNVGGIRMANPVMTASGTFGYGAEFQDFVDLNRLGAIIVKGLSLNPARGNPPPRIVETPCGMLNAIGLENVGLEAFLGEKMPFLRTLTVPVIVNLYGRSIDEYAELAARLDDHDGIAGLEINISCPNVRAGGVAFGVDPDAAAQVVSAVRRHTHRTVLVKLSPNVTDIVAIARRVEDAGADAVSLINTLTGMAVDINTRRPRLANITGGLSGPAIRPVALRMVWQVASAIRIPVVGIGGIMSAEDALAFLIVGATAVQVGTANFVNPSATVAIIDGIAAYLEEQGMAGIETLIGSLRLDAPSL
jgi:dihydroorotate dehydrogenase (NAD+) catalytic subunit